MKKSEHESVMVAEVLDFFSQSSLSTFFDGTLGAGGHARALLQAHEEIETYFGCDQDSYAIKIAKESLFPWEKKVVFIKGNFQQLDVYLSERNIKQVDGFFLIWECLQCN